MPELRFKGAETPWERKRLEDVGSCQSGEGFPEIEQGGKNGIPFFKVSDMNLPGNEFELTIANNYVTQDQIRRCGWHTVDILPAVFFAKVGAAVMLNRKRLVRKSFLMDNNTMAFRIGSDIDADFLKACFETIDLPSLSQTGALPSINSTDVEALSVRIPALFEQRKIGAFFHAIDVLLAAREEALGKLESLKKAMLEKMFPQGKAKMPEVRFKGFSGEWSKKQLGDFFSARNENNKNGAVTEILSVLKDVGVLRYSEKGNIGNHAKEDVTLYNIARSGDIILNSMNVIIGSVGVTHIDGCISPAYYALAPNAEADSIFWGYWFWRKETQNIISSLACGLMEIRRKITLPDLLSIWTPAPSLPEQQKIGSYFRVLDELIGARRAELKKLKELKAGLLERMFA